MSRSNGKRSQNNATLTESAPVRSSLEPRAFAAPATQLKGPEPPEDADSLFDAYRERSQQAPPEPAGGEAAVLQARPLASDPPAQLQSHDAPENRTGMPDTLKSGLEQLSGAELSGVRVHYNSPDPAKLQAAAYTRGHDIHVGPGQERHLPHEGWHVVQQMQGRVKPTMHTGGVAINDDPALEREADVMGRQAAQPGSKAAQLKWADGTPGASFASATATDRILQAKAPTLPGLTLSQDAEPVIQRAGTKPNTASDDGKYRIKLSSAREKFSYENRVQLGIDEILPGHHPLAEDENENPIYTLADGKVTTVTLDTGEVVRLQNPIPPPTGGKQLLVIDTVGYEEPEEHEELEEDEEIEPAHKLFMDIKIGHYTKSGQQFKIEGAGFFKRAFKNIEHNLKDINRDSAALGYDIDAGDLKKFSAVYGRTRKGRPSVLSRAMDHVLDPLDHLRDTMAAAPVTFTGSSVFIVFNLTNPESSQVKLIDPDHPIVLNDPADYAGIPEDVMTSDKMSGGRNWGQYASKWQDGFDSGMVHFIRWFLRILDRLDPR